MAVKINWHRHGTKLRHCHSMYSCFFSLWAMLPEKKRLIDQLVRVADLPGRRSLRSARSDQSSAGTVRKTVYRAYRRLPGLPDRRTHRLEQPA